MKRKLIYMAKPVYGGWVSFTAHLSLLKDYPVFKIGKRTESKTREFGYDVMYQNLSIDDILKQFSPEDIMITCIDKKYYKYLDKFPDNITIVIHDPTELKKPVIEHLPRFKIITIRKSVEKYLKDKYNINSEFLVHPFYPFEKPSKYNTVAKNRNISISRVDFDKNTDIIVEANDKLANIPGSNTVEIYGALNDLYVYHKLNNTNFKKYYKGRFGKTFKDLIELLSSGKHMVDLSSIKNDGGGTQYTFLEAIYMDNILVLNKKWVENNPGPFIHNINCIVVSDSDELARVLKSNEKNNELIINARKILTPHIDAKGY